VELYKTEVFIMSIPSLSSLQLPSYVQDAASTALAQPPSERTNSLAFLAELLQQAQDADPLNKDLDKVPALFSEETTDEAPKVQEAAAEVLGTAPAKDPEQSRARLQSLADNFLRGPCHLVQYNINAEGTELNAVKINLRGKTVSLQARIKEDGELEVSKQPQEPVQKIMHVGVALQRRVPHPVHMRHPGKARGLQNRKKLQTPVHAQLRQLQGRGLSPKPLRPKG